MVTLTKDLVEVVMSVIWVSVSCDVLDFIVHKINELTINKFKMRLNDLQTIWEFTEHTSAMKLFRWGEEKQWFFSRVTRLSYYISKFSQTCYFHPLNALLGLYELITYHFIFIYRHLAIIHSFYFLTWGLSCNRAKQIHIYLLFAVPYPVDYSYHVFLTQVDKVKCVVKG